MSPPRLYQFLPQTKLFGLILPDNGVDAGE